MIDYAVGMEPPLSELRCCKRAQKAQTSEASNQKGTDQLQLNTTVD